MERSNTLINWINDCADVARSLDEAQRQVAVLMAENASLREENERLQARMRLLDDQEEPAPLGRDQVVVPLASGGKGADISLYDV